MFTGDKYLYLTVLLIFGFYAHQQHAGNNGSVVRKEENESKEISVVKPVIKCFCCKRYCDWEKNPLWRPCGNKKYNWMHRECKKGSPKWVLYLGGSHFQRNKSGLIPLSMAIFRGKQEVERENSRNIVKIILEKVGKNVFDMVMLRDHHGCSAWMHAIYVGDDEVIRKILLAVQDQTEDSEAVWKLLTNQYAGGFGHCTLTPLMVAVKRKNIPVINLLKEAAGSRFEEYLAIEGKSLKKGCHGKTIALDFANNDAEILQLLSIEKSVEL